MPRFAVRRAIPWRSYSLSAGCILCIGGGIVFVSTPAAGGLVFGLGGVLLVASVTD